MQQKVCDPQGTHTWWTIYHGLNLRIGMFHACLFYIFIFTDQLIVQKTYLTRGYNSGFAKGRRESGTYTLFCYSYPVQSFPFLTRVLKHNTQEAAQDKLPFYCGTWCQTDQWPVKQNLIDFLNIVFWTPKIPHSIKASWISPRFSFIVSLHACMSTKLQLK